MLNAHDRMVLTNALIVASEQYRKDAMTCTAVSMRNGLTHDRLVQCFRTQADECIALANRIDTAKEVIIK